MAVSLSKGAIEALLLPRKDVVDKPIFQILGCNKSALFNFLCLTISDGLHYYSDVSYFPSAGKLESSKELLGDFTLIRAEKIRVYQSPFIYKNQIFFHIDEFTVITPGKEVGAKIELPKNYIEGDARRKRLPSAYLNPRTIFSKLYACVATKDFTIIFGNGSEVKCHKDVLAAHSSTLRTMIFPVEMKRTKIDGVEMKSISEEGINHLLRFLYGMQIPLNEFSCELVLELFKTAHDYGIFELRNKLVKLLLSRNSAWMNADCVVELYNLSKNVEEYKNLEMLCVEIVNEIPEKVQNCKRFEELPKDEALGLLWSVIHSSSKQKVDTSGNKTKDAPPTTTIQPATILYNMFYYCSADKDLVIVGGDGTEITCHKSVFAAHSDVLATMVSTGMKEAQTGRVELLQLSEKCITGLLTYMYGQKLDFGFLTCEIALELLQAAHMYALPELEESLKDLFSREDLKSRWWNADCILELYFFSKNLEEFENIKKRSLEYMAENSEEVQACDRYKQLNQEEMGKLMWSLVANQRSL